MAEFSNDNWQRKKSVLESNRYALEHEIGCDVTLHLGTSGKTVMAHKYVLFTRSPVFYAMFCGPMAQLEKAIDIPDIEPDIFQHLLRYMYWEDVSLDGKTVTRLMYAAKKYDVQGLAVECKKFLEDNVTVDNVCCVLEQAHLYDETDLYHKSLEYLLKNGQSVIQSDSFVELSEACVEKVIGADELISDEETVYNAILRWAGRTCERKGIDSSDENIRNVLGNLLRLIRFPLMAEKFFTTVVSSRQILSNVEKLSVYSSKYLPADSTEHIFPNNKRNDAKGPDIHNDVQHSNVGWGEPEVKKIFWN